MITISNNTQTDAAEAQAFGSFAFALADDEAGVCKLPIEVGHVFVAESSTLSHGLAWMRGTAAVKYSGGANFIALSNTALAGTTGTDGNLTISSSAGNFYIENRTGVAIKASVTFIGLAAARI